MKNVLQIKPRYYRWHVNHGIEWLETNTGYAKLDWEIPISQTALVLVDVWNHHYLKDIEARSEVIIREKLVPLVNVCRKAGLQIIHAPSPDIAKEESKWVKIPIQSLQHTDDWPPYEFRSKSGDYKAFAKPSEPREEEIAKHVEELRLHPLIQPEGDDVVIATGEELHLYCKQKGILFLFYAGFNTNACILLRDYGTLRMSERGYDVIIVRDCGTGMESYETHDELWQTRGAVLFLEMFGRYSVSSEDLISGLSK